MAPNQKLRVLVVDDDPGMSRFLNSHLSRKNLEVSTASSGEEAVRMFRVLDPALVLLDVAATGANGIETLERIKQIRSDVFVLVLSSSADPDLIFRASKMGADDFLTKPFE